MKKTKKLELRLDALEQQVQWLASILKYGDPNEEGEQSPRYSANPAGSSIHDGE